MKRGNNLEYVTFTNVAGVEHKAWSRKDGDVYVCMKLESSSSEPERMWEHRTYSTKEQADEAILKYVESGIKAKIFVSKMVE